METISLQKENSLPPPPRDCCCTASAYCAASARYRIFDCHSGRVRPAVASPSARSVFCQAAFFGLCVFSHSAARQQNVSFRSRARFAPAIGRGGNVSAASYDAAHKRLSAGSCGRVRFLSGNRFESMAARMPFAQSANDPAHFRHAAKGPRFPHKTRSFVFDCP